MKADEVLPIAMFASRIRGTNRVLLTLCVPNDCDCNSEGKVGCEHYYELEIQNKYAERIEWTNMGLPRKAGEEPLMPERKHPWNFIGEIDKP